LSLKSNYEGLQIEQEALQKDVGRLLEQHKRLMANARAPQPQPNWFEGANLVLSQLAANQGFASALLQLPSMASCLSMFGVGFSANAGAASTANCDAAMKSPPWLPP
jgi:hypothetical protein